MDDNERVIPKLVRKELEEYLECGLLCRGFAQLKCEGCSERRLVAFSCKGRGFCPSCMGRRMAQTAANLIEEVLPKVGLRQWVLTLPYPIRHRLAYNAKLLGEVTRAFLRTVLALRSARGHACGRRRRHGSRSAIALCVETADRPRASGQWTGRPGAHRAEEALVGRHARGRHGPIVALDAPMRGSARAEMFIQCAMRECWRQRARLIRRSCRMPRSLPTTWSRTTSRSAKGRDIGHGHIGWRGRSRSTWRSAPSARAV